MIEIHPHADTEQLGVELRALEPLIGGLSEGVLGRRYREFVDVGEYYLALEVLVALARVHPRFADQVTARLPQAYDAVDPEVVAGYCKLAGGQT